MSFWDNFLEEMRSLGETLLEWAILIVIALAILVVGRFIIQWVRKLLVAFLDLPWLKPLWDRSGVSAALEDSDQTPATVLGTIVYAYLMVVLWLVIFRVLKIVTLEDLLERLLAWIPIVFLAGIIILVAAAVANWVAEFVRPFATENGVPWLTAVTRIAIIVFGVLFALDLLNIDFAEDVVKIITFAVGAALAIAFGIGGIDTARQWWAKYGAPGKVGGDSSPSHTPTQGSGGINN